MVIPSRCQCIYLIGSMAGILAAICTLMAWKHYQEHIQGPMAFAAAQSKFDPDENFNLWVLLHPANPINMFNTFVRSNSPVTNRTLTELVIVLIASYFVIGVLSMLLYCVFTASTKAPRRPRRPPQNVPTVSYIATTTID